MWDEASTNHPSVTESFPQMEFHIKDSIMTVQILKLNFNGTLSRTPSIFFFFENCENIFRLACSVPYVYNLIRE